MTRIPARPRRRTTPPPRRPASKRAQRSAAIREYRAARSSLSRLSESQRRRGVRDETPEYRRRNARVDKAIRNPALPWWYRLFAL